MSLLQRFRDNRRGNVAVIFAISAIPVIGATAAAVDFSNAYRQRSIVQDAMDAAALAANRKIGNSTTAQIQAEAANFYAANTAGQVSSPPVITTTVSAGTVTVTATLHVPTDFMGVVGMKELVFDLQSRSTAGNARLEVALVLDTSGSMAGTKISTLKTAATNLTNTLYTLAATSNKVDPLKMAIVPFSSSVNVGPQYKTATWMDTAGKGTYHKENLEAGTTKTRFDLYNDMGVAWAGCMEERPIPYDATDDPPSTAVNPTVAQAQTLYVPMFAPDEPDPWSSSYNDYMSDRGTTAGCGSPLPAATSSTQNSASQKTAQARVCKYKGVTPASINPLGIPGGPNFMCNSTALTPLTITKSTITTAITGLSAVGATNITAGVAWGWRVLSPTDPFTEGRSYADPDNKKVIVLMTDGENTYYPDSTVFNSSVYGPYGYVAKGHLGTTSTNQATLEAAMDTRSKAACDNIKAVGITIYTIAFEVTTQRGKDVMAYCATDANKAFDAADNASLLAAFDAIGTDLSQLRIEK